MGQTFASLGRLRQITAVVARHGLGHFVTQRRARRALRPDDEEVGDSIPASARRFRAILEELGPTFIKFGQVLSTRADLLPAGFAEALAGLQDHCPPMQEAEVRAAMAPYLGRAAPVLAEFDPKPIASASIAQVHRGVTVDGIEVAIKVQRPHIRANITGDLELLRLLAQLAEAIIEESGLVTPRGVVDEFENALLQELDFRHEARMLRRFAANAAGKGRPYVVPTVYDALSSDTVLTMDFVRGHHLHALPAHISRPKLAQAIMAGAFEQLFVDGLFHADPHPGNVFVHDDGRITLVDFGAVGQISYAMRETLVVLVLSVGTRDAGAVARLLYRVGVPDERVSLHRLGDACASLFDKYLGQGALQNVAASALLKDLFNVAARFRVRIPSEYALVGRAAMTVEGLIRNLDPTIQVAEMARPIMKRLVDEQFRLPEIGQGAVKNILRARELWRDLPVAAAQILMDLESGSLRLQVEIPKFEGIARSIDALGLIIFMGLVAGGLVTGSLFILARYEWVVFGLPVVPTVALYVASILFGAALGRVFVTPRLKKISVSRWLARRRRRHVNP